MNRHAAWLSWIALGVAIEAYALTTENVPSLTQETQTATGIGKPWETIGRGAQLGLSPWFFYHCAKKIEKSLKDSLYE